MKNGVVHVACVLLPLPQVSLTQNCQPPRRSGRAAQMQTFFIALLFFPFFVGALSMVAYTAWRYEDMTIINFYFTLTATLSHSTKSLPAEQNPDSTRQIPPNQTSIFLSFVRLVLLCRLTPSEQCGPFRGLNNTFSVVGVWIDDLEKISDSHWVIWIYQNIIRSEIFYFLITLIIM